MAWAHGQQELVSGAGRGHTDQHHPVGRPPLRRRILQECRRADGGDGRRQAGEGQVQHLSRHQGLGPAHEAGGGDGERRQGETVRLLARADGPDHPVAGDLGVGVGRAARAAESEAD